MTFNLRFENDTDGPNAWENRKEMVADLVSTYAPDILGTQEGKWLQLKYLEEKLPAYRAYMPDREYDPKIQCPTLFVKKSRFEITGGKDVWLSETPDVHLSKSWDSAFPRMMSWCRLRLLDTGDGLCAGVTHLDHMGEEARPNQAKLIAQWANTMPGPKIVMGDFNEEPGSEVHRLLTAPETHLFDTWQNLGKPEGRAGFTHHNFTGAPQRARMDWILADNTFGVLDAEILRNSKNDTYPSDHFPYMADLFLA